MSADKFNSVGGYSVGIPPINVISDTGNVTASVVTASRINSPHFVGDLYGNVYGASSTLASATIADAEPENPAPGMIWWDSAIGALKIFTGTWTIAGSPAPVQYLFRYTFVESMIWLVQHNKNTSIFRETLTDSSGQRFTATINIIDSNCFEVVMTEATSGAVDVIFN